jgi:hypothetical protein
MRFSKQRTSMGGSAEAEAGLTEPDAQHPAHKLFITPRMEVDALCRLALMRYLEGCGPDLASAAAAHLDARDAEWRPNRETGGDLWTRLKVALNRIKVVDPACGEAHMLIGMLDLMDGLLQEADWVLGLNGDSQARRLAIVQTNLYGVEAQRGALSRAQQRMQRAICGRDAAVPPANSGNLIHGDSLVERDEFHWAERFHQVTDSGGFHLVVGNPPYVRHEHIEDPLSRLPAEQYKQQAFAAVQARLDEYLDPEAKGGARIAISRRSDLSLLFTVFGLSLLRPGGVLGFVLPSAISSAQYGKPLWRLLNSPDLDSQMVENLSRRSFVDAAVNTALLLAWRRPSAITRTMIHDMGARNDAWSHPSACSSHAPTASVGTTSGLGRLQSRIEERCTALGSIGRLRYPIKTGLNCFFYPNTETRARFRIEPAFLVPVVKSPRDVGTLTLTREDLPSVLFHCPQSPEQLRHQRATGALSYISWGAEQSRRGGSGSAQTRVPWPSVPSLRGRDPWYAIPLPDAAHVLCPRFLHRRFFFALPGCGILEDQTFYGLELAPSMQQHRLLVGALLNSSLSYLMMETHGRTGLGDGVRQYALRDMAALPVPDAARVDASVILGLTHAFERLAARPIMSIEKEVRRADRIELDTLVCTAIGMSETDGADARRYLTALVNRRLERARCR